MRPYLWRCNVIVCGNHDVPFINPMTSIPHFAAPMQSCGLRVLPEWIDYNGHMNVGYYVLAFDMALDAPLSALGLGAEDIAKSGGSCFTLESHVRYLQELREGAPLRVAFQLLDSDTKRLHYFMYMYHAEEEYLAATIEEVNIHVAMKERRVVAFPKDVSQRVEAMRLAHAELDRPEGLCPSMGLRRPHK